MAPSRQSDMARIAIRTLFAATIACFMTASIAGKYLDMVACKVKKTRRLKGSLKSNQSSLPQSETNHLTFHLAWRLPQLLVSPSIVVICQKRKYQHFSSKPHKY